MHLRMLVSERSSNLKMSIFWVHASSTLITMASRLTGTFLRILSRYAELKRLQ
jgi:hypothetical protein